MPLNSVQNYVKELLDGLESPQMNPLIAVISDPVFADVATNPIAYVWGARRPKSRGTAPRPIGWQKYQWEISVAVLAVLELGDPNLDSAFPLLVDQIDSFVSTVPVPVVITDPDTGFKSQALNIGEVTDLDYARMRTTGTEGQGLVQFACDLVFHLREDVSFMPGSVYRPA